MPRTVYCWRYCIELPMLTDEEWAVLEPLTMRSVEAIKAYRVEHDCSLAEARDAVSDAALQRYHEITGFDETNFNALFHHRLSLLGPDCHTCGKPLRTPRATLCAECWTPRAADTQASEEGSRI